jgi:hypothetical protein
LLLTWTVVSVQHNFIVIVAREKDLPADPAFYMVFYSGNSTIRWLLFFKRSHSIVLTMLRTPLIDLIPTTKPKETSE